MVQVDGRVAVGDIGVFAEGARSLVPESAVLLAQWPGA